ncbi:hypothetical protein ABPG72_020743 [Tetrahymena utriculariae]
MQNILQILQNLQKSSQFICLEKKGELYYLCSVEGFILSILKQLEENDDDILDQSSYAVQNKNKFQIKDDDSEQSADGNFEENEDQSQEQNKKEVWNTSSDESWNQDDYLQESSDDSWEEDQSYDEYESNNEERKKQINKKKITAMETKATMYEQDNYQILFKNPLSIDFNKMRKIHFINLHLNFDAEILNTDFSNKLAIDHSKSQLFRVQNLLEQENLSFIADLLLIPKISSNDLYLRVNSISRSSGVCLTLEPSKELQLIDNNRVKVIIKNGKHDGQNEVKIKFTGNKALKISSIMKDHICFIYHPQINKFSKSLQELLLEDQTKLKIQIQKKMGISKILNHNICKVMYDLLID